MLNMGAVLLLLIGVADAIRCREPSDPNLKEQLPNQWMGDYAQYRCIEGFKPSEDGHARCTENGWTPNPLCEEIRCQETSDPHLEEQLPNQWVGYDAQYRCREGFTPTDGRATCTENGWSPNPLCKAIRCQETSDPHLEEQLPNQWVGYAEYRCREGFTPTDGRATCTEDGWSPNPLCEVIPPCNLPTTVENADIIEKIQEVYNHGAAVTYACRTNYRMEGERTIRCQSSQWSPRTPTCIGATCQLLQVNGTTYPDVNEYRLSPGEFVGVKCDQGHWFYYNDQQTQKTFTCRPTVIQEWSTAAICQEIRCQDPNDPHLKEWHPSQWDGQYIPYKCREGFTPTYFGWARCTENGWTPNPLCEVIPPCNSPTTVENADIIGKKQVYNHGAAVTYACRTNYRMEGERTITCQNGQWSPRTPTCIDT